MKKSSFLRVFKGFTLCLSFILFGFINDGYAIFEGGGNCTNNYAACDAGSSGCICACHTSGSCVFMSNLFNICAPSPWTMAISGSCGGTTCPANEYMSGYSCTACPAGAFSSPGSTSISDCNCSAGKYRSGTSCSNCAAGKYSSAGATSCTTCPAGTYSSTGASSCTSCPSGTTSPAGSTSSSACTASCNTTWRTGVDPITKRKGKLENEKCYTYKVRDSCNTTTAKWELADGLPYGQENSNTCWGLCLPGLVSNGVTYPDDRCIPAPLTFGPWGNCTEQSNGTCTQSRTCSIGNKSCSGSSFNSYKTRACICGNSSGGNYIFRWREFDESVTGSLSFSE